MPQIYASEFGWENVASDEGMHQNLRPELHARVPSSNKNLGGLE